MTTRNLATRNAPHQGAALPELLDRARGHVMTQEELQAQRAGYAEGYTDQVRKARSEGWYRDAVPGLL